METAKFLSVNDLAARWHTTADGIYEMRKNGNTPPAHKIGRRLLFSVADVESFEAARREVAAR